jgi:DNA-binding PadR family transcriptional regulator
MAKNDLQGTLELLVLKTLSQIGSLHGYGIVLHIQRASDELLRVEEGSLYPALPDGAERMDRVGVNVYRDEPEGKVLQADRRRQEAVAGGGEKL